MKPSSGNYHPISEDEDGQFEKHLYSNPTRHTKTIPIYVLPLIIFLGLSLAFNALLSIKSFRTHLVPPTPGLRDLRTSFAGLSYDVPAIVERGGDLVENDKLWESITYYHGNIALDQEYAASLGLPRGQDFPWDDLKGIYFLNAHHGLHCLKRIRHTLLELRDGKRPSYPVEHSLHCLNALRQDVICYADDLPLYSSVEHPGQVGFGQERVCRSWEALDKWTLEYTACWRDINPGEDIDTLLRYRYCPPGSPYAERIHAIWGDFDEGENASATT